MPDTTTDTDKLSTEEEAELQAAVTEVYDDETLLKVYWALGRAGLADAQTVDAINEMQNAGILFRERGEEG